MRTENEFNGLESALFHVGKSLSYPATPPIARRVREQLRPKSEVGRRSSRHTGRMLLAAAALTLVVAVGLPMMPSAVGDFLAPTTARAATLTPGPSMTPTLASLSVPTAADQLKDLSQPQAVPVPISTRAVSVSPSAFMTPVYTAQNNTFQSRSN